MFTTFKHMLKHDLNSIQILLEMNSVGIKHIVFHNVSYGI